MSYKQTNPTNNTNNLSRAVPNTKTNRLKKTSTCTQYHMHKENKTVKHVHTCRQYHKKNLLPVACNRYHRQKRRYKIRTYNPQTITIQNKE